jgi:hypothetical protein
VEEIAGEVWVEQSVAMLAEGCTAPVRVALALPGMAMMETQVARAGDFVVPLAALRAETWAMVRVGLRVGLRVVFWVWSWLVMAVWTKQ